MLPAHCHGIAMRWPSADSTGEGPHRQRLVGEWRPRHLACRCLVNPLLDCDTLVCAPSPSLLSEHPWHAGIRSSSNGHASHSISCCTNFPCTARAPQVGGKAWKRQRGCTGLAVCADDLHKHEHTLVNTTCSSAMQDETYQQDTQQQNFTTGDSLTGSSMRFWVMAHSKSSGRSSGRLLGRGGMPHTRSTCSRSDTRHKTCGPW